MKRRGNRSPSGQETIPLVVDLYAVKGLVTLPAGSKQPPRNLREVWERVKSSLMRLVVAIVELPATTIEFGIDVISGLGRIPKSVDDRISRARETADEAEAKKQEALEKGEIQPAAAPFELVDLINHKLLETRLKGNLAKVLEIDGTTVILLTRPELEGPAVEAARKSLPPPK